MKFLRMAATVTTIHLQSVSIFPTETCGFPGGSVIENPPAMQETQVRSLGLEDSLGEGNGNPLQHSCLENPMDRGVRRTTVHGVTKSQTCLSD